MASQSPHPSVGGNKNTGEDENLWLLVNDVCIRAGDNAMSESHFSHSATESHIAIPLEHCAEPLPRQT